MKASRTLVNGFLIVVLAVLIATFLRTTSGTGDVGPPLEVGEGATVALDRKLDAAITRDPKPAPAPPTKSSRAEMPQKGLGAAPSLLTDDEWQGLPRSRHPLAKFLDDARGGRVDVREMFRHVVLNEKDRYIPPEQRGSLGSQMKPIALKIQASSKAAWDYQEEQMRLLVATGQVQADSAKPTPQQIQLAKKSAEVVLATLRRRRPVTESVRARIAELEDQIENPEQHAHKVGVAKPHELLLHDDKGDFYRLDRRRLRGWKAIKDAEDYLRVEFLGVLMNWFAAQDALTPKSRQKILQSMQAKGDK